MERPYKKDLSDQARQNLSHIVKDIISLIEEEGLFNLILNCKVEIEDGRSYTITIERTDLNRLDTNTTAVPLSRIR